MKESVLCYSVIVLLEENSEGFANYINSLFNIFNEKGNSFEILIVANGTEGFLRNGVDQFPECDNRLKLFALNRKASQAVCLRAALNETIGKIIVICGSYQQITEKSFLMLLDSMDDDTDIISPWRRNRVDPPFNQLQSRIFNRLAEIATGTELHDLSCTVKIARREVIENTELYGNMYRFLPVLAVREGFKYKEVDCVHFEERGKTGFYGFFDYFERIIDILTLYFNIRFTRKPLRFFGSVGALFFVSGLLMTGYIFLQKLLFDYPIGDRPLYLISCIFFIIIGVQAASVGLLGEIIVFTQGRNKKEYQVSEYISDVYCGVERRNTKYHNPVNYSGLKRRVIDMAEDNGSNKDGGNNICNV